MFNKENALRGSKADKLRVSFFSKKIGFFSILSRDESKKLSQILKPRIFQIYVFVFLSLILSSLEGLKTGLALGLIQTISSPEKISSYLKISIFSKSINLQEIFTLNSNESKMIFIFAILIILTFILAVYRVYTVNFNQRLLLNVLRDLRLRVLKKILGMKLSYFNTSKSGELLFLINAETSRFSTIVTHLSNIINNGGQVFIYLLLLFYFSPKLTVVILIAAAIYFVLHIPIDRQVKQKSWESNFEQNNLSHFFHELIYGVKMVRLGSLEKKQIQRFEDNHNSFENAALKNATFLGLSQSAQDIFLIAVLLIIAIYLYSSGELSAILESKQKSAELVSYLFLLVRFVMAGSKLQAARSAFINSYAPIVNVIRLLQNENSDEIIIDDNDATETSINSLGLEGVSFGYGPDKKTIDDVSFSLEKGKTYAFVGISGSGKSTALDMLSGLLKPESGSVTLNNIAVAENKLLSLRKYIGYMNQEPIIFHDTVLNNIKFFKDNATNQEIEDSIKLSRTDKFLANLPKGIETGLGERGQSVSGGERQRIGLARIFLQDKPILLLDETTNALDYETEKEIYDNISKVSSDKIILVVAHRLSAIQNFDKIFVFKDGKIIEEGTHLDLLSRDGFYKKLYNIQEAQE